MRSVNKDWCPDCSPDDCSGCGGVAHVAEPAKRISVEDALKTICEIRKMLISLKAERDTAILAIAEWCKSVDEDAGWDGWDDHYKQLRYRDSGCINDLLDSAFRAIGMEVFERKKN